MPEQFFGPGLGSAVIRNAGGRATKDAIRSITVLRSLANAASVFVIHHTGSRRAPSLVVSRQTTYCSIPRNKLKTQLLIIRFD